MNGPDQKLVLPRQFDNVTKRGIRRDPKGFVTTLLGIEADEFQVIETEQLSMKTHLADSFIRITTGSEQAIVHCEFQTHDSREVPMPFRMAGYIGSALAFYKLPIYSHRLNGLETQSSVIGRKNRPLGKDQTSNKRFDI